MKWFYDIEDLQYYNQTPSVDCYCELAVEPSDIILQAQLPSFNGNIYIVKVEVLSPDGVVVYEDATLYFEWYIQEGVNGLLYINLRAIRFSPAMCQNSCFILRVTVQREEHVFIGDNVIRTVFQAYTERYCIDNCCIVAKEINISYAAGEYSGDDYDDDEYFVS